jgi:hypothetical protein
LLALGATIDVVFRLRDGSTLPLALLEAPSGLGASPKFFVSTLPPGKDVVSVDALDAGGNVLAQASA